MLRISLLQSSLFWETRHSNLDLFSEKIEQIKEETDVIVLPEMFTTGFTMNASSLAESMSGQTLTWMKKTAASKNCAVTGSLIINENGNYYNRLIWATPEGVQHYDKRHLFTLAEEQKSYTAGKKQLIVTWKGWKIFPLICYDLRFPVWSRRNKNLEYDLLLYVANWPERRSYAWKQLLIARAIENQSYVAGVNRIGNDGNDILYTGDSVLLDYRGMPLSSINPLEERTETITLQKTEQQDFRSQYAFGSDTDNFTLNI